MISALILMVAMATVVNGNITGTIPPTDACLCFDGSTVVVRGSACGRFIGVANNGQCFRYAGLTTKCEMDKKNSTYFKIKYYDTNGWSNGDWLNLESDAKCPVPVSTAEIVIEFTCELTDFRKRVYESDTEDCSDISCENTCKGGQSVAYLRCRCSRDGRYLSPPRHWSPGQRLMTNDGKCNQKIAPRTAIATFSSTDTYEGHSAVFIRCVNDKKFQAYDQGCGRSVGYTIYDLSHHNVSSFATIFSLVDVPGSPQCGVEKPGPNDCSRISYKLCKAKLE